MLLLCITPLASCDKNNDNNEDLDNGLKYKVVDGEVVIDDENLTNSTAINDDNRVFYEIFTGSFSDSNNDGIGDLQGIINRLDYLNDGDINSGKSLGIQGIWLTPIFSSPTYHKYDVTNYYEIDKSFGTMDDLKKLVAECHKRDIKLILDLPINHSGKSNLWFINFTNAHKNNDVTNEYYDFYSYYTLGETKPQDRSFNSLTGTDVFYECNFTSNMPELNYDNEKVRQAVLDVAKYYLDLGVDGFRFDAAKYIYYGDDIKSAEFWNWYVSELKKIKPDIYTVGEVWSADPSTYPYIENGLDCFNFSMATAEGKIASAAKKGNVSVYTKYVETYLNKIKSLNNDAIMKSFLSNHDMDRAAGFAQLTGNVAHMAANLYILSPGSPFIYYGEEIGIKGSRGSAQSDANRRLAMRWGDEDTIKNPSEATYKEKNQINGTVATQIGDENSLLTHYKKLIMIRNANPEIARGEYKALSSSTTTFGGFEATYNGSTVCVLHNTSTLEVSIDLSTLTTNQYSLIRSFIGLGEAKLDGNTITLGGQTTVVLK